MLNYGNRKSAMFVSIEDATVWRQKTADEIRQDMKDFIEQETKRFSEPLPPSKPLPTHEEITAYLHRLANPTPADRAASMLNGERVARLTPRA